MANQRVGVYKELGSNRFFVKGEKTGSKFEEIKKSDINFAPGSSGQRAKDTLAQIQAAEAAAEAARVKEVQKRAAEEASKQKRLTDAQKIAESVAQRKQLQERLRQMNVKQRASFFKQQAEIARKVALKEAFQRGDIKRPSQEVRKAIRDIGRLEREEFITSEQKFVEKPQSTITAIKKLSGIEGKLQEVETERQILRTKLMRGTITKTERAKLVGLASLSSFLGAAVGFKQLPSNLVAVVKDPSVIKKVPTEIKRGGKEFGQLLRISPTEALAKVGTEIFILKGTSKGVRITGKITGKTATRLSPKFIGIKKNRIIIPSGQTAKKTIEIKIAGSVKTIKEPLKKQLEIAGKEVTAVSAQANRLVNIIKTGRVIRKPIPGEATLSKTTKRLLKRFDEGKISRKRLIELDRRIRIETKGQGNLLERSFFADPRGRLRPSRLGVKQKEATLLDILTGNVTFKTQKPQVLLFERAKVQNFPKTKIFQEIRRELKKKKPKLSKKQSSALLKFQLKKGGKFKPIGALSKEPEITLAPGEIIKKEKVIAVTLINGKRVPIVKVKVIKATKETQKLLKKADKGKISTKELKQLEKKLNKETGFKSSLSRERLGRPVVRARPIPRLPKRFKRRTPTKTISRVTRTPRTLRTPTKTISRVTRTPRTLRTPTKTISKKIVKKISSKKSVKRRKKSDLIQVFNVYGKSGKKFVKINSKPLKENDALSKGSFAIDHTTSKQFKIIPAGKTKTLGMLRKGERNYFNLNAKKLREFKIKKGQRFELKKKFIEKRKYGIDTQGEKKGLSLAKYLKRKEVVNKKKPKRKITPSQRRELLKRLEKARKVLRKKKK